MSSFENSKNNKEIPNFDFELWLIDFENLL